MVTILLEQREFIRAPHFTSADLFPGDGGRIEIVSESRRQFTPVDSLLSKGQSDCEIPAAKIWPPTRTLVRDLSGPILASDQGNRI